MRLRKLGEEEDGEERGFFLVVLIKVGVVGVGVVMFSSSGKKTKRKPIPEF